MTATGDHCFDLVRAGDKDRFLSSLFAPDDKRANLLALYAFNLEIVRIRDVVSDPQIGLIRLQWWRDTIDAIYEGTVAAHPVAEALARAIEAGNLQRHALVNLVTAHEFDLFDDPMQDLTQLEGYLGETSSALIQMAALVLAGPAARAASDAAGFAGVAYGLSQALRDPQRRTKFLPPGMDVKAAVSHAEKRLAEARGLRTSIPHDALAAFLPVTLTPLYLKAITRAPERMADVSQTRRQFALWWSARRDRF
jgi:phytoene synthase